MLDRAATYTRVDLGGGSGASYRQGLQNGGGRAGVTNLQEVRGGEGWAGSGEKAYSMTPPSTDPPGSWEVWLKLSAEEEEDSRGRLSVTHQDGEGATSRKAAEVLATGETAAATVGMSLR